MGLAAFRQLANGFTISLLFCLSFPAFGETSEAEAFTEKSLATQGARFSHHATTEQLNFLSASAGKPLSIPGLKQGDTPAVTAMQALQNYGKLFGLGDPVIDLKQKSIQQDSLNRTSLRYQQNYKGIPVIGGEIYVNLGKGNSLLSINGEISAKLSLSTQPTINAQQATEVALAVVTKWYDVPATDLTVSKARLSIYDPQLIGPDTTPASLVWQMAVSSTKQQPIREWILIDAQRGHVALHFNRIDNARNRETYTAMETFALPGLKVCNEKDTDCLAGQIFNNPNAVKAHRHTKDTYDFYASRHGRDSIDDAGMTLISTVNWFYNFAPSFCPNAFWSGTQMVYCTGMVTDDIVAHEITHGITDYTSNLYNYYQSGAINESFSDIWGEFIDLTNGRGNDRAAVRWLLGEDSSVAGGAFRNLADPTQFGQPDKMSSVLYQTSSGDNGGIHTNSGVNNKAAVLMADGGSFNGTTVSGIGIDKTAKVYYEAQTHLLTSGSDYLDLYNALYQSCRNLIGTNDITENDCVQVRLATNAVEMNKQPVSDFNPHATMCPANEAVATTLFSEDFESGLDNWNLSNAGMGVNWFGLYATQGIIYATSGIEALNGSGMPFTSDQRAAITVTLPTAASYLHFEHATDFEYGADKAYDAGVVEYSTDGGSTWHDADTLFDAGHRYNGTVDTSAINPLTGRNAYVGNSHGYVSTRVNLSSLAGQTVQLRWRVGTDSNGISSGWLLDDVSVHTCGPVPTFEFSSADYTVNENNGTAIINVSRHGSSVGIATVDYSISGGTATSGSDFTATSGTLTWTDGDMADKTFAIAITDDGLFENDETINLLLTNPGNGAYMGQQLVSELTITSDDPPPTLAFSYPLFSVSENDSYAYIYVRRSSNINGAISVDYSILPGSATENEDFIPVAGSLSWDDGDGTDKYFLIPLLDDQTYEGTETIQLTLTSPTGGAVLDTQAESTLNISDNELPPSSNTNSPSSGGGAFDWSFLLICLLLLSLHRRFQRRKWQRTDGRGTDWHQCNIDISRIVAYQSRRKLAMRP